MNYSLLMSAFTCMHFGTIVPGGDSTGTINPLRALPRASIKSSEIRETQYVQYNLRLDSVRFRFYEIEHNG